MPSKPKFTVSELFARAHEAQHDALGVTKDPDSLVALAAVQRHQLLREKTERALRAWAETVRDVDALATPQPSDEYLHRWLAAEYVRLGFACKRLAAPDSVLFESATLERVAALPTVDRSDVLRRFQLDWDSPLTVEEGASSEESEC